MPQYLVRYTPGTSYKSGTPVDNQSLALELIELLEQGRNVVYPDILDVKVVFPESEGHDSCEECP